MQIVYAYKDEPSSSVQLTLPRIQDFGINHVIGKMIYEPDKTKHTPLWNTNYFQLETKILKLTFSNKLPKLIRFLSYLEQKSFIKETKNSNTILSYSSTKKIYSIN